jgi:RND family efflux transporter MFP subunit
LQSHNPHDNLNNADPGIPAGSPSPQTAVIMSELQVNPREHQPHSHVPVNAAPGTGRKIAIFVAIVAAGLAVGFFIRHQHARQSDLALSEQTATSADAAPTVDVIRVEYASPNHLLALPGEARPWIDTTLYARVNGYVAEWKKDIGDVVHKGDLLATMETPELDDQLIATRAKLKATEAEVKVAESNAEFARTTYNRFWESPKGVVSEQERDQKKAEYDSAVAKLNAAKSQVNLDDADVQRLTEMTKFKEVRAPFDGTITERRIDIGDLVTAGSTSSTTPIFTIAQSDRIRVFVDVPQSASPDIKVGMPAVATAREYPGRTFVGKVARTSRAIDAARTLKVEVDIENQDLSLLPGMYVEVSFQTSQLRPALRIPASALNFRSGGPQAAVVDPNGTVHFHEVTIARDMGEYVEIGSGLTSGDRVVLNISNQIADGDRVSPVDSDVENPAPSTSGTSVAEAKR